MPLKIKYVIRKIKVEKGLNISWVGRKSLFNYEKFEYSLLPFAVGETFFLSFDSINLFKVQSTEWSVGDVAIYVMNFLKKNEAFPEKVWKKTGQAWKIVLFFL